MTTATPVRPGAHHPPTAAARFGYLIGAAVNAGMLWVAHHLLDWGWPRFLTEDFRNVLGVISLSLALGIVSNLVFMWDDAPWVKGLSEILTAAVAVAVCVRMLQVFPFDFSGYALDWSALARVVLVVGLVASAIVLVVNVCGWCWRWFSVRE